MKITGRQSTLIDVARKAKVSVSTAARVLRGASYPVALELQQRVRDAAETLQYVPNLLARNLRGSLQSSIGLIVGDMAEPYFGQIAQTVTVAARRRSLLAIVANMQRDPQLELTMIRELWEHRVNGLILAGGGFDQVTHRSELQNLIKQLARAGIPIISVAERDLTVPIFSVDNETVGIMAATHALQHGHTQIGIAASPANSTLTRRRVEGITSTLRKAGIRAPIVHVEIAADEGARALNELTSANPRLTMILASSDTLGVGILRALIAQGLSVPGNISIVSIGNTNYARSSNPSLTTWDTRLADYCEIAVDYLSDPASRKFLTAQPRLLPRLIAGDSVRTLGSSQKTIKATE